MLQFRLQLWIRTASEGAGDAEEMPRHLLLAIDACDDAAGVVSALEDCLFRTVPLQRQARGIDKTGKHKSLEKTPPGSNNETRI